MKWRTEKTDQRNGIRTKLCFALWPMKASDRFTYWLRWMVKTQEGAYHTVAYAECRWIWRTTLVETLEQYYTNWEKG